MRRLVPNLKKSRWTPSEPAPHWLAVFWLVCVSVVFVIFGGCGGGGGGGGGANPLGPVSPLPETSDIQIRLVTPETQAVFPGGQDIIVSAYATSSTLIIQKVEFYQSYVKIGEALKLPYIFIWNKVASGNYQLTARAIAISGVATDSVTIAISVGGAAFIEPTVSIIKPASGTTFPASEPMILTASATRENGFVSLVEYYSDGTKIGDSSVSPYAFSWLNPPLGTHLITAKVTDTLGKTKTSDPIPVTISSTMTRRPVVEFLQPKNGTLFIPGSNILLLASATDFDGKVTEVQFFANSQKIGAVSSEPFQFQWNNVAPGSFSLEAKAIDNASATSDPAQIAVVVKQSEFVITQPTNNSVTAWGNPIPITADASRLAAQPQKVVYYLNGDFLGESNAPPAFNFQWTPAFPGFYSLSAKAVDSTGKETISGAISIIVNDGPSVSISSPTGFLKIAAGSSVTIVASASSRFGTIVQVQLFTDGAPLAVLTPPNLAYTWPDIPRGTFIVTATALDNYQASKGWASATIFSKSPPSVEITSPLSGDFFLPGADLTITASASYPDGTISAINFYRDSTLLGSVASIPYQHVWTGVPTGSYILKAEAVADGISAFSQGVTISVGGVPSTSITLPLSGAVFTGLTPITVTAVASDNAGIKQVEVFANGQSFGISNSPPYQFSWTPTAYATSTALTASATNMHDLTSWTSPVRITVNDVPAISITSPTTGFISRGSKITITALVTNQVGTVSVSIKENGTKINSGNSTTVASRSYPIQGIYDLSAEVIDGYSASSTTLPSSVVLTVNSLAVATMTAPLNDTSQTGSLPGVPVPLSATAFDSDGSVLNLQFYADGTPVGTLIAAPGPYSTVWTPTNYAAYSLYAQVTDNQNATSISPAVTYYVNDIPTVTISSPSSNLLVKQDTVVSDITVSATDLLGVTSIGTYLNGTLLASGAANPFRVPWTATPKGVYLLTASVTDSLGYKNAYTGPLTITVNEPPTVTLTAPTTILYHGLPATPITVAATAVDTDGTISQMEFLAGASSFGIDSSIPYGANWSPAAYGVYQLTARATDNSGWVITSTPSAVTINDVPTVSALNPITSTNLVPNKGDTVTVKATTGVKTVPYITSVGLYSNGILLNQTPIDTEVSYTFTNIQPGTYHITASATDSLGATGETTGATSFDINVTALPAPPTVSLTAPSIFLYHGLPATPITVKANATDSDGTVSQVEFFANGVSFGTDFSNPYGKDWSPVTYGVYKLTASATDNSTLVGISTAITVTINDVPTVVAQNPTTSTNLTQLTGDSVTVKATTGAKQLASVNITTVALYSNGSLLIQTPIDTEVSYTFTNIQPGTYRITASATDSLGATGESTGATSFDINVTAPPAPPTVSLTAPTVLLYHGLPATPITVAANAADSDGTVSQVEFFANGVSFGTDFSNPYGENWSPAAYAVYKLTASATDNSSLVGNSTAISVTINDVPTVFALNPTTSTNLTQQTGDTVNVKATTGAKQLTSANITSVALYSNGSLLTQTLIDTEVSYTFTNIQPGTYHITASATDNLGAKGETTGATSFDIIVTAPPAPPTVSLTAPTVLLYHGLPATPITVSANAADSDGTVSQVEFFANGVSFGTDFSNPYGKDWSPAAYDVYKLTASATDNSGLVGTSTAITVTINDVPAVFALNPISSTNLAKQTGDTVNIKATTGAKQLASANITSVALYSNGNILTQTGIDTQVSYTFTNIQLGTYRITASATDSLGATGETTGATSFDIIVTAPHSVSITSPLNNAVYVQSPNPVLIQATPVDPDGPGDIVSVNFYEDGFLLGADTTAPYSWPVTHNIPAQRESHTYYAQLIDLGGNNPQSTPITIFWMPWAKEVAAGVSHSVVVLNDDKVWSVGNNDYGQLGNGNYSGTVTPTEISGNFTADLQVLACGEYHCMALDVNGDVWEWGYNNVGQIGDSTYTSRNLPVRLISGNTYTAIAAGSYNSLALDNTGNVWSWGWNNTLQLGRPPQTPANGGLPNPAQIPALNNIDAIAAGKYHGIAHRSTGNALWSWGADIYGQLGNDLSTSTIFLPITVNQPGGFDGTIVAAGLEHSLAINNTGAPNTKAWGWGKNDSGQLGNWNNVSTGTLTLVDQFAGLSQLTAIAAGQDHTLALKQDKTVWVWGSNAQNQLGTGLGNENRPVQLNFPLISGSPVQIDKIAAGAQFSFAIDDQGRLWGWGMNSSGQLGDGTSVNRPTPTQIIW